MRTVRAELGRITGDFDCQHPERRAHNLVIIGKTEVTVKSIRPTRDDWFIALVLAGGAFLLYLRTLAPGLLPGDAGEFQFAAWRLGLAHPTGYPLYLLLGGLWQHVLAPLGISPATALNVLSALFATLSVGLLYLFMLGAPVPHDLSRRLVAAFAAVSLAANATFWSQALLAEVYTLHALLLLLLLFSLQRLMQDTGTPSQSSVSPRNLVWVALIFGISLAHHAMTLLAAPAVLAYLFSLDRTWSRIAWRNWLVILAALALPLALYAYVPLRSGPAASPWYHQSIGDYTLSLYQNDWSSFVDFVTGRSISVGFHDVSEAIASLPAVGALWYQHFGIIGLTLIAIGLYEMAESRRPLLWLTGGIAMAQQIFNLFYAIGDIAVYYIPLYVVGIIWAAYGVAAISERLSARWERGAAVQRAPARTRGRTSALIALVLLLIPFSTLIENYRTVDQSGNRAARAASEQILSALPQGEAILVSNDRDEITPLLYLQHVEGLAPSATALHPLIAPDPRFADLGATIDTALRKGDGTPVYLIKPMPGLEVKYDLAPANSPLVRVDTRNTVEPSMAVSQPFGPLTLLGYDWLPLDGKVLVRLHWQVNKPLYTNYTTSLQLFDTTGRRVAQSDRPPGGVYYPTSLWKPGERLVEEHLLTLESPLGQVDSVLQIAMYTGPKLEHLAEPLRLTIPAT